MSAAGFSIRRVIVADQGVVCAEARAESTAESLLVKTSLEVAKCYAQVIEVELPKRTENAGWMRSKSVSANTFV